jgi:hypothetical protein
MHILTGSSTFQLHAASAAATSSLLIAAAVALQCIVQRACEWCFEYLLY